MFTAPLRSLSACVCAERMQLQRQLDFPTDGNLNTRPSVSVMSQRDPKHSAATFFLIKKSFPNARFPQRRPGERFWRANWARRNETKCFPDETFRPSRPSRPRFYAPRLQQRISDCILLL